MRISIKKVFVATFFALFLIFGFTVKTSADDGMCSMVPSMPASEIIADNVQDAIISEIDVPEIAQMIDSLEPMITPRSAKGCWKYIYTADPYSFFKHTKTGQWRMIQTTSTLNHTTNTIIGGWANAPSAVMYYNAAYKNLLGGC